MSLHAWNTMSHPKPKNYIKVLYSDTITIVMYRSWMIHRDDDSCTITQLYALAGHKTLKVCIFYFSNAGMDVAQSFYEEIDK